MAGDHGSGLEVLVSMICESSPPLKLYVGDRETVRDLKHRLMEWELDENGSLDCSPHFVVHLELRLDDDTESNRFASRLLDNTRTVQSYSGNNEQLLLRLSLPLGAHISASRYIWQYRRHGIIAPAIRGYPGEMVGESSQSSKTPAVIWRDRVTGGILATMRSESIPYFKNGDNRIRVERIPTNQEDQEEILGRVRSVYCRQTYGQRRSGVMEHGTGDETFENTCSSCGLREEYSLDVYHIFGKDSLSFVNDCYQREDMERKLVWDFSIYNPETVSIWPSEVTLVIKEGDILIAQKEVQHWMVVVEVCDNGHPVVVDFCPATLDTRHHSSNNMIHGTTGCVGRSLLSCNGAVLFLVCDASYDRRRTVKNAELAYMLYIDEKLAAKTPCSNGTGELFTYSAIGLNGGFNCEDFVAACRDGIFEDYVNALALEYKSENPKKKAIRLIRNISRLGHQVSGWEYRVATAATFTTAYAAQVSSVSNPWVVTLGSTVLFGQMTVLYAVCDVIFTAVDVTHDYIQVTQRRMSMNSFLKGVNRKVSWCGARVVAFWIGGKLLCLFIPVVGVVPLVFEVGGLIGVSLVNFAQFSLESDYLNRMGSHEELTDTRDTSKMIVEAECTV